VPLQPNTAETEVLKVSPKEKELQGSAQKIKFSAKEEETPRKKEAQETCTLVKQEGPQKSTTSKSKEAQESPAKGPDEKDKEVSNHAYSTGSAGGEKGKPKDLLSFFGKKADNTATKAAEKEKENDRLAVNSNKGSRSE